MDIFQIAGVCVLAAVLAVLVRQTRPELSLQIGLAVSAGVFLLVLPKLSQVLSEAQLFLVKTGLDLNFSYPLPKSPPSPTLPSSPQKFAWTPARGPLRQRWRWRPKF